MKSTNSTTSVARRRGNAPIPAVASELMPLTDLCGWLESRQLQVLCGELSRLNRLIPAAVERDGASHPQLLKLQEAFAAFCEKFTAHLREEAKAVFPLIRRMENRAGGNSRARRSLQTHTARLEQQHFEADEAIAELRALAEKDCPPELHKDLARFERSLHEQIYEENRVLYPRALAVSRA